MESGGPIPAFGERMEETSACLRPKPGPAPKINSKTLPRTTLPETAAEPVPHGWTLEASSAWEKSASDVTADPRGAQLLAAVEKAEAEDRSRKEATDRAVAVSRVAGKLLLTR